MKKVVFAVVSLGFLLLYGGVVNATNGDMLIGIGPISRSMGGVGVAAPQDSISAVFENPAGMAFAPCCPGSQVDFSGTIFLPKASAQMSVPGAGAFSDDKSRMDTFIIPAIGITTPISKDNRWRFGLAAYGVSGMGVDYRDRLDALKALAGPGASLYTQYSVMKFAPNLSYMVNDNLSLGVSVHLDYANLDLGQGASAGYGVGAQVGAIYRTGPVSFGFSYVTPQSITHDKVADFDGNGVKDDLKLEIPQTAAFGIAYKPWDKLLLEADVKWINWANANGYKDFDWRDQYVFSLGVQYQPIKKLFLRAGVNYGKNPVKEHNGFNGASTTNVQGTQVSTFQYELLRVAGFPAVAETHVAFGVGYEFTEKMAAHVGYTHGFNKSISETGTLGPAGPAKIAADLSEDSVEFGLSFRF